MERVRIGVLFQIFRTAQVSSKLVNAALDGSGITGPDYAVYSYLLHGPMTLTDLAEGTGMPLTTAAGYVQRFEERGHLSKRRNPADGRSYLVELTPDARKWLLEIVEQFAETIALFDAVLVEEGVDSAELVEQLGRVQELIEKSVETL